jgi:FKBP-type peptidyl-prolyl cis-trans isomerase (trigger factor)
MKKPAGRSLADFVKHKRCEGCKVCALPKELLDQIRTASERKIKRTVVLEWLKSEHGAKISDADLTTHHGQRHGS